MKRTELRRTAPIARGTSTLKRTPLARSAPSASDRSLTLTELRAARGATPIVRHSTLRTDPAKARAWRDRSRKELKPNRRRQAKRALNYRRVLASDFHKKLRYAAFLRSGGLCECEDCTLVRGWTLIPNEAYEQYVRAITPISVWFTKRGAEPWQRFRSKDGEIHHTSYKHFGAENPDELRLVQWVWKTCHQRIEAEHGTRRKFLTGKAA